MPRPVDGKGKMRLEWYFNPIGSSWANRLRWPCCPVCFCKDKGDVTGICIACDLIREIREREEVLADDTYPEHEHVHQFEKVQHLYGLLTKEEARRE